MRAEVGNVGGVQVVASCQPMPLTLFIRGSLSLGRESDGAFWYQIIMEVAYPGALPQAVMFWAVGPEESGFGRMEQHE